MGGFNYKPKESLVTFDSLGTRRVYTLTALGLETMTEMAALGHTEEEIARYMRVPPTWIKHALDPDHELFDEEAHAAFHDGGMEFVGRLRRAQADLAETNAQMSIHLGRHVLGQKEGVQEHRHVHQVVGTLPNYDASAAEWRSQFAPTGLQHDKTLQAVDVEEAEVLTEAKRSKAEVLTVDASGAEQSSDGQD